MKKLLVLMLVLGMASMANAVPVWDLTYDGTNVYVGVTTPDIIGVYMILHVTSADGVLSNFAKGAQAPSDSQSAGINIGDLGVAAGQQGEWWAMADTSSPFDDYHAGQWMIANWALQSGHTSALVTVQLFDEGTSELTVMDTIIVPEPMTMALLGLGSLFLLRRRK